MKLESNKSRINDAGFGLFSKKYFKKGDFVVTYFGQFFSKNEIYDIYTQNKFNYIKNIHPFIRDVSNNSVIYGQKHENINKCGVLVNDYVQLKSTDRKDIQEYIKLSTKNANVIVNFDNEYPEYIAIKRIKKNEEIYVHYGLGWWFMHLGISAEEINKMNTVYNFDKYYKK